MNRLAKDVDCPTCSRKGEVERDGAPARCLDCDGLGFQLVETMHEVDEVEVDIGEHIRCSFSTLEGKGRVDRRRARSEDELVAMVRAQVGTACLEMLRQGQRPMKPARAQAMGTAVVSSGVANQTEVDRHLPKHLAK